MAFIEIIFPSLNWRRFFDDGLAFDDVDVRFPVINDIYSCCLTFFVDLFLSDERRIAIEVRVCEPLRRRTGVIDDVEPKLAVVVAHPCSAPDDLFKLRQRADDTGDHDVLTSRGIDTRSQQL